MIEQQKRLIEAERRIARLESTLHRTNVAITSVQGAIRNDSYNVPNPFGVCEGGGAVDGYFVNVLEVRQIGGYHYPSGSPGTLTEYTSATTPDRLRFWNSSGSPQSMQVDNFDVSEFTFSWTLANKVEEGNDIDDNRYAIYHAFNSFSDLVARVKITERTLLGNDLIESEKVWFEHESPEVVTYTFRTWLSDVVSSASNTLRSGTSGERTTGYGSGQGITLRAGATAYSGGNSNHIIRWTSVPASTEALGVLVTGGSASVAPGDTMDGGTASDPGTDIVYGGGA